MVVAAGRKIFSRSGIPRSFDSGRMVAVGGFLALIGFLLHNFVDFDLYVPSIAMSAWFIAALIAPESGLIRTQNFDLSRPAHRVAVFVAILLICGGGVYWTSRIFHSRVYFSVGEDILRGRNAGSEFEGIETIEHGLRLDPLNHNYHLFLGEIHFQRYRYKRAIGFLEEAQRLNSLSHRIQFDLACARFRYGKMHHWIKWERFLADLEATVRLFPGEPFYRFIHAYYLNRTGRKEAAREQFMTVLVLDPGLKKTLRTVERIYNDPGVAATAGAGWVWVRLLQLWPAGTF